MPAVRSLPARRLAWPAALVAAVLVAGPVGLLPGPAKAQEAPAPEAPAPEAPAAPTGCEKLASLMKTRGVLLQRVQGYQKKRPTAAAACSTFSELNSNTSAVLSEFEANGAWCHVPPEATDSMKQQKPQIAKAQGNACSAAAQQKKQEAQMRRQQQQQQRNQLGGGPIGGGGDVLGGTIKVPKGAL